MVNGSRQPGDSPPREAAGTRHADRLVCEIIADPLLRHISTHPAAPVWVSGPKACSAAWRARALGSHYRDQSPTAHILSHT